MRTTNSPARTAARRALTAVALLGLTTASQGGPTTPGPGADSGQAKWTPSAAASSTAPAGEAQLPLQQYDTSRNTPLLGAVVVPEATATAMWGPAGRSTTPPTT